jgi:rubrerythrin
MESMFTRKKTVGESEQMISEISIEEIREEFRRLALREKVKLSELERQKWFEQRMKDCEKLNELIKNDN